MSIAFQKHTEITARHMNPYVGYEGSIKGDDVFQCPVLLERKQSCDAFEETCNGFAKIDENTQASDDIQSEENVALFIPQRNSVISSASPTKIAAVSESRNQSPSGSSSDEMHSARMKDSELISLDTHPVESDHKTKSTNNVTAVSTDVLTKEEKDTPDFEANKGFINVHLEGFSHFFPHNLHTLHRRQLFCDVTDIHAHKVVLAACSPYFYRVLENDHEMDNNLEPVKDYHRVIDLGTSVTASGLQFVVECMYTSSISLSEDTAQEILQASAFLDMQLVVETCLEFLKKRKTDDVTRKQYVDDRRDRCSSERSVTELKVTATETNRSLQQEETNPECSNAATTSVPAESIHDTKGDAIYQVVSCKDVGTKGMASQRETSINHPTDLTNKRSVESSSSTADTSPDSQNVCAIDSDDDVFVKKESSPSASRLSSTDSGLHDCSSSTLSTPGAHDAAVTAETLRRRQSEFYRQVLANNPYLLNPEAMAAAVAMTSLTSPLRSPANQNRLSVPSVEQSQLLMIPAWHHIFGNPMQPTVHHSNTIHRIQGHVTPLPGGLQPSQYMDLLQQHRMRQQAILNLSGSVQTPAVFDSKIPDQYSTKIRGSVISPPYNPIVLSKLLQSTHDLPCSRSLKRSLSANSADRRTTALDKPSLGRFPGEKSAISTISEEQSFSTESTTANCRSRTVKRRRSTSSRSGSPDRPYKCMVCAAEFNRPANLKTHMRIHSGEKPYKCQSCGARFVQVAHLRAHILIHTGEKPYPCKVCGTRFRHLQTLKSHFRIHTGEKPYACDECQVKFRHKSQLRLHLRTKHGINTNTKKTYQQVPGLNSADISAHIKRTQEAVRMQSSRREY